MSGSTGSTTGEGLRRALLSVVAALAFLTIVATPASAEVVINLAGQGAGMVTSNPAGIDCSNVSGSPGPSCSGEFPNTIVETTAAPAPGFTFSGWKADDPNGQILEEFLGLSSCNSGSSNPCSVANVTGSTVHVTAIFQCLPPIAPPAAVTGQASAGQDPLTRTLEGTVNPNGCGLEGAYFEYGTTTGYGSTTATKPEAAALGAGSAPVPVTAETDLLEPNTTYHYRLVAVGPGGTVRGEDQVSTTGPPPADTCPNAAIRAEQGTLVQHLPDCMALEMVSPPQKAGQPAADPNVSLDGRRVSFSSAAPLGENPPPTVPLARSLYVASRSASGWATARTLPDAGLDALWKSGRASRVSLTPDFSRSLWIGATNAQKERGVGRAFAARLGGGFSPLSEPLVPFASGSDGTNKEGVILDADLRAASADHSHLYFQPGKVGSPQTTYLPDDPAISGPGAEEKNIYLVRLGAEGQQLPKPELLQRDESGRVWGGECGARLGGIGAALNTDSPAPNGDRNQGAVSADGSRTYFSARAAQPQSGECEAQSKLRILQRIETPSGPQISQLFGSDCDRAPSEPCSAADGDDLYQGASLDQTKVYFNTNRQLADTDGDGSSAECDLHVAVAGCDLYLYDRNLPAGERLIQVSAGEDVPGQHERGSEADVYNGITAISADGSRAYLVATGVLTNDANPENETAAEGQPNLYMFDERAWKAGGEEGGLTFVGTLAPNDGIELSPVYDEGLWGGQGTWKNDAYPVPVLSAAERRGEGDAEEGGDGRVLVFQSHASLASNDADGGRLDVYRYDSDAGSLQCVSCRPGSSADEPDEEPFDVQDRGDFGPLETDFAEHGRWVSEDGDKIVFSTAEGLLPGDVNGVGDVYLWRSGEIYRVYAAVGKQEAEASKPVLAPDGATIAFATARPLLPQDGDTTPDVYVARVGGGFPNPPPPNPCEPGSNCQQAQVPPAAPAAASESPTSGNPPAPRPCRKGKVRRKGHCVAKHKRKTKNHRHTRHANSDRRMGI